MEASFELGLEYAQVQDQKDPLYPFKSRFHFPKHNGADVAYFCGNSLGLQPRSVSYLMDKELKDWADHGVEGHFRAANPWLSYHNLFSQSLAAIVGAEEKEVVACNTLTVNLHLLMISFYRPTKERYKIIMEAGAFPSDQYAMETQVMMHGFTPEQAIIEISPREGEYTLRDEDILAEIEAQGKELALVMLGGVNYYTGQFFNLEEITKKTHEVGAIAGFDLAHAVGNLPLSLHDWDVDFACWCSYKYLNSGPGGVAGMFVNERHGNDPATFRLAGWWGNEERARFKMEKGFEPAKGAAGWQMSNAPVFNMVGHLASLDLFDKAGMEALRNKSKRMTQYLYWLLEQIENPPFVIITPKEVHRRGAQLSLLFQKNGKAYFDFLTNGGIIADWREPNVIRVAPVPMYNTYADCYKLFEAIKDFSSKA